MDQLFGDATTAMPTPAQQAEVDSLMSARSPIPSLDIRRGGGGFGNFGADNAIPGLDINPPNGPEEDGKPTAVEEESRSEGIGGWISRLANRSRGEGKGTNRQAGSYKRLDQQDE